MSLEITDNQHPFALAECAPKFTVSLYGELKKTLSLKEGSEVAKTVALSALKSIAWKADIKAFFSKPIVVIVTGVLLFAVSFLLPHLSLAAKILQVCVRAIAGGLVGYGAQNWMNDALPRLSQAYAAVSAEAKDLIGRIEQMDDERETVTFDPRVVTTSMFKILVPNVGKMVVEGVRGAVTGDKRRQDTAR